MTQTIEYDCEGCGLHVFAFGIETPPRHQLCSTCHCGCSCSNRTAFR